ncbi:GspH/FimT family pseudopilin [Shewanella chilikensis]|uniref:GspH/FimT family pseudopilin n=1 Tax=Shewanella chilikensis TaxID=558541 RepID=UPI003A96911C
MAVVHFSSSRISGFTLVELMVTIAVAAILLSVGVPSLTSLYESYRSKSEISRIEQALSFARNQAISYGMEVKVCGYQSDTGCAANFDDGLKVYTTASGSEKVLRVVEGIDSKDAIKGSNVGFHADGLSNTTGEVTFIYCPSKQANGSRSVTVSSSGMIKYGADGLACPN